MEPAVGEPMLDLRLDRGARGDDEVAVYADGRVIWLLHDALDF
jgi:hypothetical protein